MKTLSDDQLALFDLMWTLISPMIISPTEVSDELAPDLGPVEKILDSLDSTTLLRLGGVGSELERACRQAFIRLAREEAVNPTVSREAWPIKNESPPIS